MSQIIGLTRGANPLLRWLYGWEIFFWAYKKARMKKHGAGPQSRLHAYKTAQCARFIADGQHRAALTAATRD